MRKIYALLAAVLGATAADAQLTGTKNIPGDYATLAAAITDLNTQGVGAGGVILNLAAGNAQTAPAGGYVIGGAGSLLLTTTSAANSVQIRGNGNTVTASAGHTAGAITDAVFKLVGADNVALSGFVIQENAANTVNTAASNTMTEWGIALLAASPTDGAQNNRIQNNAISLNRTYLNTFGIYSNTRHSFDAPATAAESTAASGSNSNNQVYANQVSNVNIAISFVGSSITAAMDQGNDIGGTSAATGNTITDFGGGSPLSTFTSVLAVNYAIHESNQLNENVSYNTITSATGLATTTVQHGGIFKFYSASPAAGTVTVSNINNNMVTVNNAPTTGQVTGITAQGMTALASATINMNNNVVTGSISGAAATSAAFAAMFSTSAPGTLNMTGNTIRGITSTATSGGFFGIQQQTNGVVNALNITNNKIGDATQPAITFSATTHSGGVTGIGVVSPGAAATAALAITGNDIRGIVNTGAGSGAHNYIINSSACLSQNISNNTFTNITAATTGSVTFIGNNITTPTGGSTTINNNAIVTAFTKTGAGGTVAFLNQNGSTTETINEVNSGNNFSNVTLTGATTLTGWFNQNGTSASPFGSTKVITNNTFSNITGGTSAMTIMTVGYSNANSTGSTISGNTISNITGGGAVTGIVSPAGRQSFFNNTVTGLTGSGTGAVTGISITGGVNQMVYQNKVGNLENTNAGGSVAGIQMSSGTTTIHNNLVGDLRAPAASGANVINGINITGGTTANVYFNTVYLNATSAGTNFGTSALSASSTPTLDLRNNILVNTSTAAGTGLTVAFRRSSTTLTTYGNASNNNLFWAGTPSAANLIFYDGTNADQTLAAFQARVTPRDVSSISENIVSLFVATNPTSANFLHLTPGSTTAVESGGTNISGITTDYDGNTRAGNAGYAGSGSAPDIGADEFAGISTTPACVAPTTQGSALVFGTASNTTQAATFTAAGGTVTGYLIVRSTGAFTGTPVNGTAYSAGNTIGNGTVVGTSTTPSFSATGLVANTAYTYTVFAYNSGACTGGPVYNTTAPLSGNATTCAGVPTAISTGAVASTGFTVSWTAPAGGTAGPVSYTIDVATDNDFTNIVNTQTVTTTTASVTGLNPSTPYFYRVRANNGVCASAVSNTVTVSTTCPAPATLNATPGSRCGVGPVTLQATTDAGGVINWYTSATAVTPVATGTSFTTPSLSASTTYYAEAAYVGTPFTVGLSTSPAANLGSFGGYGMYFSTVNSAIINSIDIYPSTAGTLRLSLRNAAGTEVDFRTFTITAADISTTVKKTLTLGFRVPAGATGWSLYHDLAINRAAGTYTYPYTNNGFSITGNTNEGNNLTAATRYYFFDWNVTQVCASVRTAVIATINTAPALTVAATPAAVCAGSSTTLSVQSSNASYTYVWTPGNLTGASVSVTPNATTKYYVTATDNSGGASNGCVALDSVTVTVNPLPTPVNITLSSPTSCVGGVTTLTATGGLVPVTVLTENFNGTAAGWTTANNSTGGTPANAAWTLVANGSTISTEVYTSNDASQFVNTSSDAQGSGALTSTILNAPVINSTGYSELSLNFYHYHRVYALAAYDSATVEVSTNGTTWTAVRSFKGANTGTSSNFAQATINLNAYVNQPTLYIRFRYAAEWAYNWAIDNVTVTGIRPSTIVWTPAAGLFTDAAATTPYTGGNATTVYAKPTAVGMYGFTATATSAAGCSSTGSIDLTVAPATAITTQPAATQLLCPGSTASFTVVASGANLSYQWKKNGVNIPGATNATYTINSVSVADASVYTVVVTGACGTVTSATAGLEVRLATAITTQPAGTIDVCAGNSATFTVAATGENLSYQWKKGGNNISGATSASYTINPVSVADAATYTVVVTGACGTVTSANAVLNVNAATAITTQPTAQSACSGGTATFTVAASGTGISYQWRKNGTNITGATNATYSINPVAAGDAANYDVVITGACGSVTSTAAALTITAATTITTQPVGATACEQSGTTFSVAATGAGTLSYQWRKNGVNIPGATNATYSISSLVAADAGSYDVVVTGSCGPVTSNPVTLVVNTCLAVSNLDASISSAVLTPNAVRNTTVLRVNATRAARIQWQLVDSRGAVVMTFTQSVTAGNNQLRLQLGHLAGGTYLLYGNTDKGKTNILRAVRL